MLRKLLLTLSFGLAALLVAALGYWNLNPESLLEQKPQAVADNAVDFYVINAKTTEYQLDGTLRYEMTSDKVEHLKESDKSLVSKPDLLLYRETSPLPWHVQSDRGEVSPGGTEVELIDNVRIARTDEKNRPTIITSSRMTVFPDKEFAQTQQAVRIEAANGVNESVFERQPGAPAVQRKRPA